MSVIFGCGDIGRRIAKVLLSEQGVDDLHAYVNSVESAELCARLKVIALKVDLDNINRDLSLCHNREMYYTVPPQKEGTQDKRSRALVAHFQSHDLVPKKVVLISTTGVYGDCDGEWVTEQSSVNPQTERAKRRLDSEQVWLHWGETNKVPVVVLRVPGIYSFSRLPRTRLMSGTPVVHAAECGYSNRIHADDLAQLCVFAMLRAKSGEVFNATDGVPGKISEYLQLAAHVLGMDSLPEISMSEARKVLSDGMMSYLGESRKISNQKILNDLGVKLMYPDVKLGIKV